MKNQTNYASTSFRHLHTSMFPLPFIFLIFILSYSLSFSSHECTPNPPPSSLLPPSQNSSFFKFLISLWYFSYTNLKSTLTRMDGFLAAFVTVVNRTFPGAAVLQASDLKKKNPKKTKQLYE